MAHFNPNAFFAQTKNGTAVENQLSDMDLNYWMPGTVTYLSRNDWAATFPQTYSGLPRRLLQREEKSLTSYCLKGDPEPLASGPPPD